MKITISFERIMFFKLRFLKKKFNYMYYYYLFSFFYSVLVQSFLFGGGGTFISPHIKFPFNYG